MSYEGFRQLLCERGHLVEVDCYEQDPLQCDRLHEGELCGKPIVFTNQVDDTNGDQWGVIPNSCWNKLKIFDEVESKCSECHQSVVVSHAQYRVPTDKEAIEFKHFVDRYDEYKVKPLKEYHDEN